MKVGAQLEKGGNNQSNIYCTQMACLAATDNSLVTDNSENLRDRTTGYRQERELLLEAAREQVVQPS